MFAVNDASLLAGSNFVCLRQSPPFANFNCCLVSMSFYSWNTEHLPVFKLILEFPSKVPANANKPRAEKQHGNRLGNGILNQKTLIIS